MARSHARLGTDIWAEDTIRNHTRDAQRAYLLVLSQPELSRCGVLPFRLRRLAQLAADDTPVKLRKAIRALEKTRHLIVDEDAEELLVRTYVRHDGLLAQPQVVASMVTDFSLIDSWKIRAAFLAELRRIWDHPRTTDAERKGLRLALGEHETDRYADRLGPALGPVMRAAIEAGSVAAFDPACPAGCPAGFAQALAGAPARSPSPAPTPAPTPVAAATPGAPTGHTAPSGADSGGPARTLLHEHTLTHGPLPATTARQLEKHLATALADGTDPEVLTAALTDWTRRPTAKPGLLPHLIGDHAKSRTANGHAADPLTHPDAQAFLAAQHGATR